MSAHLLTTSDLCRRLAEGWTTEHVEIPSEYVARLQDRLSSHGDIAANRVGNSTYQFVLVLNQIRFLGATNLGCLILSFGSDVEHEVPRMWESNGGAGLFVLILATSAVIKARAEAVAQKERSAFISGRDIEELLHQGSSVDTLKRLIRAQIPIRRLIPFDIMHPASSNMFYGRPDLLKRLSNEDTTSFAIAGPGRIGKSSILRQYTYDLKRNFRDERRWRLYNIDFYSYGGFDPNKLAQRVALDISADSESNRVNCDTFLRFLRRLSHDGDRPLELLLDEVDAVCWNLAFQEIGTAVRSGYCRVIICGKGALLQMMRKHESTFSQRLELIQPEPLDLVSARRLLFEPLNDLGFAINDASELSDAVIELTQRRPQLVQACAKRLVETALSEGSRSIGMAQFERIRIEFAAASSNFLPLDDMLDDETRLAALLILQVGGSELNVGALQQWAINYGVVLSAAKALDIFYDLWICNVLTWEKGTFKLADKQLIEFARSMRLDFEITRLRQKLAVARLARV